MPRKSTEDGNLIDARPILAALRAVRKGDFDVRLPMDQTGVTGEVAQVFNDALELLDTSTKEVERVSEVVGTEGKISQRASLPGATGGWARRVEALNALIADLVQPIVEVSRVIGAVAEGDLSKRMTLATDGTPVQGEFLQVGQTVNTMVDQLGGFASEVTRVAREVGTEGKLGGQANVLGMSGTWQDLTDNVNLMAANLTNQVRDIAVVVTAVAQGDLKRKLTVEAKGEIAALANTMNEMTDTLAVFADQVTTVAREVGVEGKLGGQASVPGAAGTWKDLTDNVNQLAANLSTQVRAIAEVATAVTKGDLTQSICVAAQGEVEQLKNNLNDMIRNLRETTRKNAEQDWLKTNLTKFSRVLEGQKDPQQVSKLILSELANVVSAQHGVFYLLETGNGEPVLRLRSSYAYRERKNLSNTFRLGEGLVGECALEKQRILLRNVPADYVQINSGLGEATPLNIVVMPVLFESQVRAVLELSSFGRFTDVQLDFLDQVTESIGVVLHTISTTMRTEELLTQSQSLTEELQAQQEELRESNLRLEQQAKSLQQSEETLKDQQLQLQQTNEELEEKAEQLSQQKTQVERKNEEIESARATLQERAEQLAISSRYKSEFLANMSHELRTPLNSLLILSKMLADNEDSNLTDQQVEYSRTIHGAGSDLLSLINGILDMAKIESGKMSVDISDVPLREVKGFVERGFRPLAEKKQLQFHVELANDLPRTIRTDAKRLQQVLRNLLSNAFKFTEKGAVSMRVAPAANGWTVDHPVLSQADAVVAISVADTGIAIPADKLRMIFEPFQQSDGGTSRKYGGTGLGLSISREIAGLLGGEITVRSQPDQGSEFIFYLPVKYVPPQDTLPSVFGSQSGAPPTVPALPRVVDSSPVWPAANPVSSDVTPTQLQPQTEKLPHDIHPGDRVLLIIEDDPAFAAILVDVAEKRGFKALVAAQGQVGLEWAQQLNPDAITLDVRLPDVDGWIVLDQLKQDYRTRKIPVHVISATDDPARALTEGAIASLAKPATRESLDAAIADFQQRIEHPLKSVLIVEDNEVERDEILRTFADQKVRVTSVASGSEAMAELQAHSFDCMVLDLGLPDVSGVAVLDAIRKDPALYQLPVVVYTGRTPAEEEERLLREIAESVVVKNVQSPERLLAEASLFLQHVEGELPARKRRVFQQVHETDAVFRGRKILVADDDVRNVFALTAALEHQQMEVLRAEDGRQVIDLLESTPDIDLVLMDIMMPVMDGYEAMRAIRQMPPFEKLPIIALTAKAMKGDRERCIEAGASDYLAKPVNADQLLSLMRVWLYDKPVSAGS